MTSTIQTNERKRQLEDCSHEYLVERVINDEIYLNELVQVLGQFFPFLSPAINEIGYSAVNRHEALEAKFPISGIILPPKH
jgi:hypothetical protein